MVMMCRWEKKLNMTCSRCMRLAQKKTMCHGLTALRSRAQVPWTMPRHHLGVGSSLKRAASLRRRPDSSLLAWMNAQAGTLSSPRSSGLHAKRMTTTSPEGAREGWTGPGLSLSGPIKGVSKPKKLSKSCGARWRCARLQESAIALQLAAWTRFTRRRRA